jgi:hypothetical protein
MLSEQTKIGLTFGQIILIITVIFSFTMSYANLTIRINDLEQKTIMLEKEQLSNENYIEIVRTENRSDHIKMMDKLDMLILKSK